MSKFFNKIDRGSAEAKAQTASGLRASLELALQLAREAEEDALMDLKIATGEWEDDIFACIAPMGTASQAFADAKTKLTELFTEENIELGHIFTQVGPYVIEFSKKGVQCTRKRGQGRVLKHMRMVINLATIEEIVTDMEKRFNAASYRPFSNNCIIFSYEFQTRIYFSPPQELSDMKRLLHKSSTLEQLLVDGITTSIVAEEAGPSTLDEMVRVLGGRESSTNFAKELDSAINNEQ